MKLTTVKDALWRVLLWVGFISLALLGVMSLYTLVDGIVVGDSQLVWCGVFMIVLWFLALGMVIYECDIL